MTTGQGYKQFATRVPEELHRRLKVEAARRGVSMAELVESAVERILTDDEVEVANAGAVTRELTTAIRCLKRIRKALPTKAGHVVVAIIGNLTRLGATVEKGQDI